MKIRYASAGAFRDALEARIKDRAEGTSSVPRLRKQIAFERLLARLQQVAPDAWA